jgi:hypothetical protein
MLHGALAKEAAYEQEWELPEEKVESNLRLLREARGSVGVVDDALEDRTNMLYETERVFYYFGRPFRYARALNRRPRLVRGHDRAVAEMDSVLSRASLATSEDEESLKGLEAALWSAPGGRVGRLLGQRSNSEPLGIVAGMSAEEYSVLEAVEILRGMGGGLNTGQLMERELGPYLESFSRFRWFHPFLLPGTLIPYTLLGFSEGYVDPVSLALTIAATAVSAARASHESVRFVPASYKAFRAKAARLDRFITDYRDRM